MEHELNALAIHCASCTSCWEHWMLNLTDNRSGEGGCPVGRALLPRLPNTKGAVAPSHDVESDIEFEVRKRVAVAR